MDLLRAEQLKLRLGGNQILRDISLHIQAGESVGLLGPSGCGKSTLVRVLLGLQAPSSGTIEAHPSLRAEKGLRPDAVGYVPQDDIVHKALTVEQALFYASMLRQPPGASPEEARNKVKLLLRKLDLTKRASTRIHHLSGGERKRVNLGMELLTDPALLFLDEPTAGLDPHLEREMMKLFRSLATPSRSVMVTTHRLANITMFATVLVLYEGTLVFGGTPEDALCFFQVDDHERIYSKVRLLPPEKLALKFRQSEFFDRFRRRKPQEAPTPQDPKQQAPKQQAQVGHQATQATKEPSPTPNTKAPTDATQAPGDSIEAQLARLKSKVRPQNKEEG